MLCQQIAKIYRDIKEGIKKSYNQIGLKTPKFSGKSFASRLMTIVIVFAVSPVGQIYASDHASQAPQYKTTLAFNKTSPFVLEEFNQKTTIVVGKSNFEISQNPALAQSEEVLYPDSYAHTDPNEFRPIYYAAGQKFNIPWQLIEAVHEVESGKSGSTNRHSYAGAIGPMQFMPGTWRGYAVDGDGDGKADITNVNDAIYTAAHYLAASGADEGRIDDAIFNYNHSQSYVNKVKNIAYEIGLPR